MKKLFAILLTLSFAFSLTACKQEKTPETQEKNNSTQITQSSEDNTAEISESSANNSSDSEFSLASIQTYSAASYVGNTISANLIDTSIVVSIEPVEVASNIIDIEFEEPEFDFTQNIAEVDKSKIDKFTETELKEIALTKANLLNKLTIEFKNSGINVSIDETSGEIAMDSSVLFGGDSAVLSDSGKNFLKTFINTYSSVVFSDEFDGFISKIQVEGHTAPVDGSTYESGLPLSKERAKNVKDYCLSDETGISSGDISKLSATLEAVGLSNSKPVKDSSGNVDMVASRRVSFRFFINFEK